MFWICFFYKPKEAFEECDIYEWSKRREIEEGGDINAAVKEKERHSDKVIKNFKIKISDSSYKHFLNSWVYKTMKGDTLSSLYCS